MGDILLSDMQMLKDTVLRLTNRVFFLEDEVKDLNRRVGPGIGGGGSSSNNNNSVAVSAITATEAPDNVTATTTAPLNTSSKKQKKKLTNSRVGQRISKISRRKPVKIKITKASATTVATDEGNEAECDNDAMMEALNLDLDDIPIKADVDQINNHSDLIVIQAPFCSGLKQTEEKTGKSGTKRGKRVETCVNIIDDSEIVNPTTPNNEEETASKLRSSTNGKFHKCSICDEIFDIKSDLDTHKQIHAEGKIFSCDICARSYTQKRNLSRHLKQHSDSMKDINHTKTPSVAVTCFRCNQIFKKESERDKHLITCSSYRKPSKRTSKKTSVKDHHTHSKKQKLHQTDSQDDNIKIK